MVSVIFEGLGIDKNVIEVHDNIYFDEISKDIVDEVLESGRCIAKPERHHSILKTAEASAHRGRPFMTFGDTNEIIGSSKIDLREVISTMEKSKKVRHRRNWVSILSSDIVQLPIINT